MTNHLKGKIFNEDIQAIEKDGNYKVAFKLIEKENEEFKKRVLNNIKNTGYVYSY